MQLGCNEAQTGTSLVARDLATRLLRPGAAARAARHGIEPELVTRLGQAGLLGVNVAPELGGRGAGAVAYAMALSELAAADAAVAVTVAVTNMVAETLCHFGTAAQVQRWVPRLVRGELFAGAFALSEPQAGSDASSLTTRATMQPGGWRLDGEKLWITSGDVAGLLVVWARTGVAGARGISCFLVDPQTPGVTFGKPEDKMGLHASHTVAVGLDGVAVDEDCLLGSVDGGFRIAMHALDGGRIGISAQAVGVAREAVREVTAHVAGRTRDDALALRALGGMACRLEAATWLSLHAAGLKDAGTPFGIAAAKAKLYASEAANGIIRTAMDVVGLDEGPAARRLGRLFRDCRVTQVYEGTSEIQRLVISRDVLRGS